jgi:hypothetical protein
MDTTGHPPSYLFPISNYHECSKVRPEVPSLAQRCRSSIDQKPVAPPPKGGRLSLLEFFSGKKQVQGNSVCIISENSVWNLMHILNMTECETIANLELKFNLHMILSYILIPHETRHASCS